jgi:hypothetical protein
MFGAKRVNWKEVLLPEMTDRAWLDTALLAGEAVSDMLRGIGSGRITDAQIDPQVIKAFHLQYPNVGEDFTGFVREHSDPEQLRGVVSAVKGKLFEMAHAEYLNEHLLPQGYVARLADSPTQAGYDIVIEGPDHHCDYLQDKLTDSVGLLRKAAERWPDIDIAVPQEVAAQVKDPDLVTHVIDSGISGEAVSGEVGQAADAVGPDVGWHFPWLIVGFTVADEGLRFLKRKTDLQQFLRRAKRRLTRSLGSSLAGQAVAIASGEPTMCLVSIPMRILGARFDSAKAYAQRVDSALSRIHGTADALRTGRTGRAECFAKARLSLLIALPQHPQHSL